MYSFDGSPLPANNPLLEEHMAQFMGDFTDEELNRIRAFCDQQPAAKAGLVGKHDESHVRVMGARLPLTDETRWIYERLGETVRRINDECFQFDLSGLECLYYLRYNDTGEHFDWHPDSGPATAHPRKLSLTLQLSDPSEYEGAEFDVMIGSVGNNRAAKAKGSVTAFASHRVHRVTPLISGERRVLLMFAVGPNFR